MARNIPVHSGYTIVNGTGHGQLGHLLDVWVEYKVDSSSAFGKYALVEAYFYAALRRGSQSVCKGSAGLNTSFFVDGVAGETVSDGAYEFMLSERANLLGSFAGQLPYGTDTGKSITFAGSFTVPSEVVTGGEVTQTVTLSRVLCASALWAEPVLLEQPCALRWQPATEECSFAVKLSLGDWQAESERIYPKTNANVNFTDIILPLELAGYFSGKTGTVTATLTTYRGNVLLGTDRAEFQVTLPENEKTLPIVTARLQPVCDAFPGQYVQHLGKVHSEVTAEDPLEGQIAKICLTVGDVTADGTVAALLTAGTVPVRITAESARGFTGAWEGEIQVLPYAPPRLTGAEAFRCREDGNADPGGTYLWLGATPSCSVVDGSNTAAIYWRLKAEGGDYGEWKPFTESGVISGITLEKEVAYTAQLQIRDSADSAGQVTLPIPQEQVYMHRTPNAMGLGGYAEGHRVLDLYWDLRARRSISGAYIRTVSPGSGFTLQFTDPDRSKQSALLLSGDVQGLVSLSGDIATWQGTEGVELTVTQGAVTVTLPQQNLGQMLILSPDPITI